MKKRVVVLRLFPLSCHFECKREICARLFPQLSFPLRVSQVLSSPDVSLRSTWQDGVCHSEEDGTSDVRISLLGLNAHSCSTTTFPTARLPRRSLCLLLWMTIQKRLPRCNCVAPRSDRRWFCSPQMSHFVRHDMPTIVISSVGEKSVRDYFRCHVLSLSACRSLVFHRCLTLVAARG